MATATIHRVHADRRASMMMCGCDAMCCRMSGTC
ncbi:hypothetical protein JS278_01033 [Acidipropionibacterium virtanenii]|uniref:Uncharacterized protein n=1 Tax=Acidipropionibacterium virtanenii TaxID=2057246 RepID=A0A344USG8_9ACTN|nr:hypothetical protein JS278_01033 [Acidipropionibacterium virtanenii]